ncbi:MAG: putative glycoside hydrolase [Patescibacteria group bacterium]
MRRAIGSILLLASMLAGMFPIPVFAARGTQSAPKLLNLYLDWRMKDADVALLSRWDLVVLDMDLAWSAADKIRAIRAANPNIKIIAYVSAGEMAEARARGNQTSPGYKLSQVAPESLFMHSHTGSRLTWWPGAHLMNATDLGSAPHWADVLPTFVHDEMMSTGLWDGVFLDASYSDITSFYGTDIDPDGDGKANSSASVNAAWRSGMSRLLKNMRTAVGTNGLILVNSSVVYASQVNGILLENFPRYGWAYPQGLFQDAITKNVRPSITAYNTNTNNADTPADYRAMRFGLMSALLGDGFYSFDAGPGGHAQAWWYDEYEVALGKPVRAPQRLVGSGSGVTTGVWSRQFENGLVIVNSDTITHHITLPRTYETLHGTQDKKTNSGAIIRSIDVPPQDGVMLLGRQDVTDVRNGSFQNGSFIRVYEANGGQQRNGFFAQRDDAPSGAQTIVTDLAQDGSTSIVTAAKGVVTVQTGSKRVTFRPFGATYTGSLSIAVGNGNLDKALEIIVGRDKAKSADVRTFTKEGKQLIGWTAYNPAFAGGVRVAIGDLDGDGLREIVTGAGPGGGPHIRLFKTDGKPWGGSFFAFDQSDRGGVSVALGDIDGDAKADIIVGSGEGAIPRVRVFDYRGTLKREFTLGTKPLLGGITVTAADMDGDGSAEILVGGLPVL